MCPHCKSEIDAGATRCPHCQGKIKVSRQLKWNSKWTIGIGIIVGLAFLGAIAGPQNPGEVSIGGQGYLRISNGAIAVIVARTKQAEDAITKAQVANDPIGEMNVVDSNQAFQVLNGTQVQVIDSTFTLRQVRILGGDHLGESGWVPAEYVSAQ